MKEKQEIRRLSEEQLDVLITKILTGNYTQEEYDVFSTWISESSENAQEFSQIKSFWNANVTDRFDVLPSKGLDKLMKRVNKSESKNLRINAFLKPVIVAATLFIGIFLGMRFSNKTDEVIQNYSFITGESISTFTLPDGSVVHLNRDSRLDYNSNFGLKNREVRLLGEAYFDVTSKENCKFIVDLEGANIVVKGTSFDAYNYGTTGLKGAALVSGKIEFKVNSQSLQLTPARQIIYDSETNELKINEFDRTLVTAWKDRLFRYKSLSFNELVEAVQREYNINIVLRADDFGDETYSGALDVGMPANGVLDIITQQADAVWRQRGDVYYVEKLKR